MTSPAAHPFALPVRVYYEDTDAAGVVYYANYLKFMERARTEWLSALGFEIAVLEREHGIAFVVRRATIDYLRPARLGDRLDVTFVLAECRQASLVAQQEVRRGDETLARARISLACLDHANWRPARIPAALLSLMETAA